MLFGDRAAFAIDEVIAVKCRCNFLFLRRVRQQIARKLFDGELRERHVAVHRFHDPVAPHPLEGIAVLLEAVAVRVSGRIEPR